MKSTFHRNIQIIMMMRTFILLMSEPSFNFRELLFYNLNYFH